MAEWTTTHPEKAGSYRWRGVFIVAEGSAPEARVGGREYIIHVKTGPWVGLAMIHPYTGELTAPEKAGGEWFSTPVMTSQQVTDLLETLEAIRGQYAIHGDIDNPELTQLGNWTLREVDRAIGILKGEES